MSEKPERRESPLRGPGGRGLDPHVQATLQRALRVTEGRTLRKVTVRLPADLVEAIGLEAHRLTKHNRRGMQDLMAVLLRYGWEAYQRGDLEVELQPTAVAFRIVAAK